MRIIIRGQNLKLTPAIRAFTEEKIGGVTRLLGASERLLARVEVGKPSQRHKSGPIFYAEVNLSLGSRLLRAHAEHQDLYSAIDKIRDEIERQIRKFKTKRTSLLKRDR